MNGYDDDPMTADEAYAQYREESEAQARNEAVLAGSFEAPVMPMTVGERNAAIDRADAAALRHWEQTGQFGG